MGWMGMIDYRHEFDQWLDGERKKLKSRASFKKKFIGSRGYAHFDTLLSIHDAGHIGVLEHNFTHTSNLLKWKFMPFVRNDQRNRRYRRKPADTGPVKHRNQKLYSHIKSRPIMYASHHDACLYSFFNFIIDSRYEAVLKDRGLNETVLAYRSIKGHNNIDFAKKAFDYLSSDKSDWACLLIDISSFFDNVPHDELFNSLVGLDKDFDSDELRYVLRSLTNYRYVIEDEVIKEFKRHKKPYFVPIGKKAVRLGKIEDFNELINNKRFVRKNLSPKGFPQGSPASGMLANVYMLDFDEWVSGRIDDFGSGMYQRYSDDILIICPVKEVKELYKQIQQRLKSHGLSLSKKKTEVFVRESDKIRSAPELIETASAARQRVQYLGLEWDGSEIILRPSTVARRLRPKNRLAKKYWRYHEQAIEKIKQTTIAKQYRRIKSTIRAKSTTE